MRKVIFISILSMVFFSAAQAQDKKYLYKDSTLQDSEQLYDTTVTEVIAAPVEDEGKKVIYEEATEGEEENVIDTSLNYNQLTVSPDSVAGWKNLKSFAYVKYLDSLLKAKKESPKEQKKESTYTAPSGGGWLNSVLSSGGLQFFLWLLAILFVLFILYKLFLTEGVFRRRTNTSKTAVAAAAEEEVITSESDFDTLIKQAVQQGNYRLAVRYQYLKTLHKLAGKKLVELATDKTNYQYVREISNHSYQNDFAALTLNYEYVWYGEFEIDGNIYYNMNEKFKQLNNRL